MFRFPGFVSFVLFLLAVPALAEDVSNCFQIREMQRTEPGRYGVHAVSRCSKTYDAVYVMVSFFDNHGKHLDDGVWAIYWCRPGRVEIHEFAVPRSAIGFHRVSLRGITTDAEKGLGVPIKVASAEYAAPANVAKTSAGASTKTPAGASTGPVHIIGDPGER